MSRVLVSLFFWLATLSFFASMWLRDSQIPEAVTRTMYRGGSLWTVFVIYTAMIALVLDVARILCPKFKCNVLHACVISLALLCYGHYNYRNPRIVPMDIVLDKPMTGALKMVVVSDLHLGHGTGKGVLKRFVRMINNESPDVILIAGDLIDNSVDAVIAEHLEEELSLLQAPMGVYMSPGNHEYISGYEECERFLENTPIKMLRDTVVNLPCGVQLLLRDDAANKKRLKVNKFVALADEERPMIMVDHHPREIAKKDKLGVDLQISGHTHHGQVWPGNYITDYIFEQSNGYRKWSHSHVWVSSGLSLWGPSVRLGTDGDIAVITLRGEQDVCNTDNK